MGTKVLYIGGVGRSGSTLLEKLLNELPTTFSVGETLHLWERGLRDNELCGCGNPFDECVHWTAVGPAAFGSWDQVDVDRLIDLRWRVDRSRRLAQIFSLFSGRKMNRDEQEYTTALQRVLAASAEVSGGSVMLESSKHLSTAALMAATPGLDVSVIHLVRDPRGVAYSWTKEVARPEADGSIMPQYRPSRSAARWVTDNAGFEALARLGVPTVQIRYEDMLADPAGAMRAAALLAGISLGPGDLDYIASDKVTLSRPMHSIAGNPMRFGGETLQLRLDERWRDAMTTVDQRTVARMTSVLRWRYSYR